MKKVIVTILLIFLVSLFLPAFEFDINQPDFGLPANEMPVRAEVVNNVLTLRYSYNKLSGEQIKDTVIPINEDGSFYCERQRFGLEDSEPWTETVQGKIEMDGERFNLTIYFDECHYFGQYIKFNRYPEYYEYHLNDKLIQQAGMHPEKGVFLYNILYDAYDWYSKIVYTYDETTWKCTKEERFMIRDKSSDGPFELYAVYENSPQTGEPLKITFYVEGKIYKLEEFEYEGIYCRQKIFKMSDADELWLSELRTNVYDKEWKFYKTLEFRFYNENGTVKEIYSRVYYLDDDGNLSDLHEFVSGAFAGCTELPKRQVIQLYTRFSAESVVPDDDGCYFSPYRATLEIPWDNGGLLYVVNEEGSDNRETYSYPDLHMLSSTWYKKGKIKLMILYDAKTGAERGRESF